MKLFGKGIVWVSLFVVLAFGSVDRVQAAGKNVEVQTQEELEVALKEEGIKKIVLTAKGKVALTIPEGNYADRSLIVKSKKAELINKGTFNAVRIMGAEQYVEAAKGNKIAILDDSISIEVAETAKVKKLVFKSENAEIALTVNGALSKVQIAKVAYINLDGKPDKEVTIVNKAPGSSVVSLIPVKVKGNVDIIVEQPENEEVVDKHPEEENQEETVEPTEPSIEPEPSVEPSLEPEISGLVEAIEIKGDFDTTVGGTVYLTAEIIPNNAQNKAVAWYSSDESIAVVDADGRVTGLSLGTTLITAVAMDGSGIQGKYSVAIISDITDSIYEFEFTASNAVFTNGGSTYISNGGTIEMELESGASVDLTIVPKDAYGRVLTDVLWWNQNWATESGMLKMTNYSEKNGQVTVTVTNTGSAQKGTINFRGSRDDRMTLKAVRFVVITKE